MHQGEGQLVQTASETQPEYPYGGVRNVLADERLFLPTMDITVDFLRIAHGRIMTVKNEPYHPIFIEKPGLFLF